MKNASILFALSLLVCLKTSAQEYHIYSFSVSPGLNRTYADTKKSKTLLSINSQWSYAINKDVHFTIDALSGWLEGGDDFNSQFDKNFKNRYIAFTAGYRVSFGAFFKNNSSETLEALKNTFIGVSGGVVRNDIRTIQPKKTMTEYYPIIMKSYNLIVPISIGYDLPLTFDDDDTRFNIRLAYQGSFTFGEGLDGYNEIGRNVNKNPDIFTVFSLGLVYRFGPTRW